MRRSDRMGSPLGFKLPTTGAGAGRVHRQRMVRKSHMRTVLSTESTSSSSVPLLNPAPLASCHWYAPSAVTLPQWPTRSATGRCVRKSQTWQAPAVAEER